MRDLSKILNADDRAVLETVGSINWIPKEPTDTILPYMEEISVDEDSISDRKKKTEELISKYDKIIEKCNQLEAQIDKRCQNVKISISPKNNMRVIEAMGRVFGIRTQEITFEHYKKCVAALADLNNQLPNIRE